MAFCLLESTLYSQPGKRWLEWDNVHQVTKAVSET